MDTLGTAKTPCLRLFKLRWDFAGAVYVLGVDGWLKARGCAGGCGVQGVLLQESGVFLCWACRGFLTLNFYTLYDLCICHVRLVDKVGWTRCHTSQHVGSGRWLYRPWLRICFEPYMS